eukprot:2931283-Rhodomonas_salina.4
MGMSLTARVRKAHREFDPFRSHPLQNIPLRAAFWFIRLLGKGCECQFRRARRRSRSSRKRFANARASASGSGATAEGRNSANLQSLCFNAARSRKT